jgi:hypothetical protein
MQRPDPPEPPKEPAQSLPPVAPGSDPADSGRGLPMPHERDESNDDPAAHPRQPVIEQARRDLESGQVDTDLRTTPGLDAERRDSMTRPR